MSGDGRQGQEASTSLGELIQLLIELSADRAWGNVSFAIANGQIGIVKIERHYKPGTLPIRDRSRLEPTAAPR